MAKSDVTSHFVNCAQAKNILEDVYLNILKHKGVVEESKGLLSLARREKALEEARSVRTTYHSMIKFFGLDTFTFFHRHQREDSLYYG